MFLRIQIIQLIQVNELIQIFQLIQMFQEMFQFFIENKLPSSQSGFKPVDSCINQLLSITHEIYSSFDEGLEVRSVFLNISKAFDKVWHDGIVFQLTQNGMSGNLLQPLRNFLNERKQWVVLNGQFFSWKNVNAGVPQGSILGPLLFLIYINGLTEGFSSNAKLFADDTLSANNLNKDLERISNGLLNGKRTLIQILLKKLKKSFLVAS